MSALRVLVDGAPMNEDEARAFWKRFSEWMEGHEGDLAGFARAEGLASVRPEMHETGPVLVASRTTAQAPYGPAAKRTSLKGPPGRATVPAAGPNRRKKKR